MDRRPALSAVQGSRAEGHREMDHRRRFRRWEAREEYPAVKGARRRARRLRAEWRAGPSRPRIPVAADRPRLRGHLQREMAAAHQGRGPALSDLPGAFTIPGLESP